MKKLIHLEFSRFSLKTHLIGILIANICILLLSVGFSFILSFSSTSEMMGDFSMPMLRTTDLSIIFMKAILIVWEAVLISSAIIEEYKNKTICLLFTYPVNRMKLIFAKLMIIGGTIFSFYCLSSFIQYTTLFLISKNFDFISFHFENIGIQILTIVSAIALGFIPMSIEMIRKSVITTLVSSLIIVSIVSNSQIISTGLLSVPVAALTLGIIGLNISINTTKK